jgi:hypothetical protein
MAPNYGLDDGEPVCDFRQGETDLSFAKISRPCVEPSHALIQWTMGVLSPVVKKTGLGS